MSAPRAAETPVAATAHTPVLRQEVVDALQPRAAALYVDGTFGAGGYSSALLDRADCKVIAVDRDPQAVAAGAAMAQRYAPRLILIEGRFGDIETLLAERGIGFVDGVALDLGVSSMQIDQRARGFSFRQDGPLDMRMEMRGPSAADVVNGSDERMLADIVFTLGEERHAKRIARAIVAARAELPITQTGQLAQIIHRACPPRGEARIDTATRTFQALRLYVNDELGELERGLVAAVNVMNPGARLAVVSFHSLEDRAVKRFMRARAGEVPRPSRHAPLPAARRGAPSLRLVTRRPIVPGAAELAANPRARSAKLRVAEAIGAAP